MNSLKVSAEVQMYIFSKCSYTRLLSTPSLLMQGYFSIIFLPIILYSKLDEIFGKYFKYYDAASQTRSFHLLRCWTYEQKIMANDCLYLLTDLFKKANKIARLSVCVMDIHLDLQPPLWIFFIH